MSNQKPYYTQEQVKQLLKDQRETCAKICYGRIRMGNINREDFYERIKNSNEPEFPKPALIVHDKE